MRRSAARSRTVTEDAQFCHLALVRPIAPRMRRDYRVDGVCYRTHLPIGIDIDILLHRDGDLRGVNLQQDAGEGVEIVHLSAVNFEVFGWLVAQASLREKSRARCEKLGITPLLLDALRIADGWYGTVTVRNSGVTAADLGSVQIVRRLVQHRWLTTHPVAIGDIKPTTAVRILPAGSHVIDQADRPGRSHQ